MNTPAVRTGLDIQLLISLQSKNVALTQDKSLEISSDHQGTDMKDCLPFLYNSDILHLSLKASNKVRMGVSEVIRAPFKA